MSIYQLINKLCVELIKDCDCDEIDIKQARKIAFEVLLKKSVHHENLLLEKTVEDYQFTSFELSLNNKSKQIDAVDQFIELLKENSNILLPAAAFLIHLKNIDSNEIRNEVCSLPFY